MNRSFGVLIGWLSLFYLAGALPAHPVSISSTIVDVYPDRLDVDIEIMLEDLVLYHGLTANAQMQYAVDDFKGAVEKHRQFLLDYFTIIDEHGQKLSGKVASISMDQVVGGAVGQTELMKRTVGFKLHYPLNTQPKFLTFLQNFGGPQAALPAVMELHVLREGRFGEPGTQMPRGRPYTVQLDWTPLPEGKRLTLAELRQQRRQQIQQRLGISSYTGLFSFLYINRFEVRHEVLVPFLTLDQWLPIPRKDPDVIDVAEQEAAVSMIENFFAQKQTVTINGQPVGAKLMRLNFFGLDINDFALNAEARSVSTAQARVGIILAFPASEVPREIALEWNAFSEYAPLLNSVVLVENDAPQQFDFFQLDNTYRWRGELVKVPLSGVPASTKLNAETARKQAVGQLLLNIYRAFDLRDDEQVYDALSTAVDGPLLRDVYLRTKRSLVMAEQGGALAHVQSLEVQQLKQVASNDPLIWEVTWQATGVTEHWGHLHTRTNQYRGRLGLASVEGNWKLSQFQLLDEKNVRFETSIRGYDSGQ